MFVRSLRRDDKVTGIFCVTITDLKKDHVLTLKRACVNGS